MNTWRIFLAVLAMPFLGQAQVAEDAIRLSFNQLGGTARTLGIGGAAGAMGADFGTTLINPAGISLARASSLVAGISFQGTSNQAEYISESTTGETFGVQMPTLGYIFTKLLRKEDKLKTKGLVSWHFSFGFNRVNDFNRQIDFSGENQSSSILDAWADQAFGVNPDQLDMENSLSGLAWSTYLIDRIPNSVPSEYQAALESDTRSTQKQSLTRSGRINDWHLGLGFNISNRIHLGAAMLFPGVRFENVLRYEESYDKNNQGVPASMIQNSQFLTEGVGFGGRFGAIVKTSESTRIGISYQTKIRYGITDEFSDLLRSNSFVAPGQTLQFGTGALTTSYTVVAPARLTFSGTIVLWNSLLLSADYEMVDYGNARLESSTYGFASENSDISTAFSKAQNVRIGAEFAYYDWRFRTGFALLGQPYSDLVIDETAPLNQKNLTFGLGYTKKSFFADIALVNMWMQDFYTPYTLDANVGRDYYSAENRYRATRMVITAGLRF